MKRLPEWSLRLTCLLPLALPPLAWAAPLPPLRGTFLVNDRGLAILGQDGREKERIKLPADNGARSPDGRWLACVEFDHGSGRCKLILHARAEAAESVTVPLIWGQPGTSGCELVWSPDGRRLLIGESGLGKDRKQRHGFRVYEPATGKLTLLNFATARSVTGWSADGKRLLATVAAGGDNIRLAWLNADGKGFAEFLTPAGEVSCGGRLSPDGRRVLLQSGPPGKALRLYALNLSSGKWTLLDEPGETHGYCWSPDGSRVAYTWQRPLDRGGAAERETLLITCDPEGRDHRTITSRKYRPPDPDAGVIYFFTVLDWR